MKGIGDDFVMTLEEAWNGIAEQLKKDGFYYESLIKEIPDDVWSLAKRNISSNDEVLIQWFNSEIPAFDNKRPVDIALFEGEKELRSHMLTLPD